MKAGMPPSRGNANVRRENMPQIIVTADKRPERGDGAVMLRERVTVSDFESDHFVVHLLERLGWAVGDAHEVEREARDETPREIEHHAPDPALQPVTS
jgi:hypothetical protein